MMAARDEVAAELPLVAVAEAQATATTSTAGKGEEDVVALDIPETASPSAASFSAPSPKSSTPPRLSRTGKNREATTTAAGAAVRRNVANRGTVDNSGRRSFRSLSTAPTARDAAGSTEETAAAACIEPETNTSTLFSRYGVPYHGSGSRRSHRRGSESFDGESSNGRGPSLSNNANANHLENTTERRKYSHVVDAFRLMLLPARRLLWAFWRRRSILSLRSKASARLARVQRHRFGNRLIVVAAVVMASLSWFLIITAIVGPPGGKSHLGSQGIIGGGGVYTGGIRAGSDGQGNVADDAYRSYYTRIVSEVGVGPSLTDPWVVREIDIAAAEWDWDSADITADGDDVLADGVDGGHQMSTILTVADREGDGGDARGGHGGRGRKVEWDGRVKTVVTGDLVPEGQSLVSADLLLTIFSGSTGPDAAKRELLRQIYDKYDGWVKVGGPNSISGGANPDRVEFTVSIVFVMSKPSAPPEGELIGDILYVPVEEGYRNIVLKTKAMLCLVRHFDFKYLLKADDDSFVCLARIASMLHDLDPGIRDKIYAGVPTACNQPTNPDHWNGRVMKNPHHRWFDSKYVQHTLGGLDCFPVYMQGAFYILAQPLVEHLYRGHEHLECFTNEDVTIGSWLMGVDREMVEMYNLRTSHLWDCLCARTQITARTRKKQKFFHNCKGMSQMKLCGTRLLRPGIGC